MQKKKNNYALFCFLDPTVIFSSFWFQLWNRSYQTYCILVFNCFEFNFGQSILLILNKYFLNKTMLFHILKKLNTKRDFQSNLSRANKRKIMRGDGIILKNTHVTSFRKCYFNVSIKFTENSPSFSRDIWLNNTSS